MPPISSLYCGIVYLLFSFRYHQIDATNTNGGSFNAQDNHHLLRELKEVHIQDVMSQTRNMLVSDGTCFENDEDYDNIFGGANAFFFAYYETSKRDLFSLVTKNGYNYDYTKLLNLSKAPCTAIGGTLYSITQTQVCADQQITHYDKNIPFCVAPTCVVNEASVLASRQLDLCKEGESSEREITVQIVKTSTLNAECRKQIASLESEGLGQVNIDLVAEEQESAETSNSNDRIFDFSDSLVDIIDPCEKAGGILYKYSDVVKGNEYDTYYYNGETVFLNAPVCVGSSCEVDDYFTEVFIPTNEYRLEGNFRIEISSHRLSFGGDGTYPVERSYEFLGYEKVYSGSTPKSSSKITIWLYFLLFFTATILSV